MCELFGVSSRKKIAANEYLKEFLKESTELSDSAKWFMGLPSGLEFFHVFYGYGGVAGKEPVIIEHSLFQCTVQLFY